MPSDHRQDVAASALRRLDEFARRWTPRDRDPVQDPDPSGGTSPGHPGRHATPAAVAFRSAVTQPLQGRHLGLIVLAAVMFVLIAVWWTARGGAEPMPVADTTPAAAPLGPTPSPSPSGAGSSSATPAAPTATPAGVVVVDVAGKVRRPAVVTLPAGSRVVDAIRKAGGARPGVDLSPLNLARVLVDGEQILVGRSASRGAAAPLGTGAGGGPPVDPKTNLNTATEAELEELPGVGPVTARKIVAWREEHGEFSSADELLEVPGIGPKTLAEIAPEVTW